MIDICEQLSNYMILPPGQLEDFVEGIVNDQFMAEYGYENVTVKADDPSNPKCPPNTEACWSDEDEIFYYNPDIFGSDGDTKHLVETIAHESLHAMDYQDYGDSSDGLGDEVSEKYTVRLYDQYGEDGEVMYSPRDVIPGIGHSVEVYRPAREIADKIVDACRNKMKEKSPAERESILSELQRELKELLDKRWGAEDKDGSDG